MTASIRTLLLGAQRRLAKITDSPRLEAEVLLAHAASKARSYLYAWPDRVLDVAAVQRFGTELERRLRGEPLAYILGQREFWSMELLVTPATLIPRPETELLVELALGLITRQRYARIADLGTGSGAIALAIASERTRAGIVATDSSAAALAVAARNARRFNIGNIEFRQGDWWSALPGERFDLVVTNPPYIAASDPHLRQGDLRFEPVSALLAGSDGLEALRAIIADATDHLHPGGWLLVEHGYDQADRVGALLRNHGLKTIACHRDTAGCRRVSRGQRPVI